MCNTSIYICFDQHWRHQRKSTWPKIWLCNRMCFRSLLWSFAVANWRWSAEAGSHFSIRLFRHLNPNPTFDNTQIQKYKNTKMPSQPQPPPWKHTNTMQICYQTHAYIFKKQCRNIKMHKLKRTLLTKRKMWSVIVEVKMSLYLGDCSYKNRVYAHKVRGQF